MVTEQLKRYTMVMIARGERGFSLIELIVAMAFMGVVILSLFELFAQIRQANRQANNYTIATQVGQQIIELYRNTSYVNIPVGTRDYATTLAPYANLKNPRSATAVATEVDAAGLKQIDVTVSYNERSGIRRIQFTTLVASKGINR